MCVLVEWAAVLLCGLRFLLCFPETGEEDAGGASLADVLRALESVASAPGRRGAVVDTATLRGVVEALCRYVVPLLNNCVHGYAVCGSKLCRWLCLRSRCAAAVNSAQRALDAQAIVFSTLHALGIVVDMAQTAAL